MAPAAVDPTNDCRHINGSYIVNRILGVVLVCIGWGLPQSQGSTTDAASGADAIRFYDGESIHMIATVLNMNGL